MRLLHEPLVVDPRFPIGEFDRDAVITTETRRAAVANIAALPQRIREAVAGLDDAQLDAPYRTGGWTVRELVPHMPD
jgi:hypothetical protein